MQTMDASALQTRLDLSKFSTAECVRIWEVLQKDFKLRYEETRRLQRIQRHLEHANEKVELLSRVDNFNEHYCIVCFDSFIFLVNRSYVCYLCTCNVCGRCSRFVSKFNQRLCRICEEEKDLEAKKCSWFYSKSKKTYTIEANPAPIKLGNGAASLNQESQASDDLVEPVPSETHAQLTKERSESEEALKRITGVQIMRFQQKMNSVATDLRTFLRKHVCYEIPEPRVDKYYDSKIGVFRNDVITILRNFSQTLYIAIEGYHSRTGLPIRNVHREVQMVLQDEVENLVGYRVDVAFSECLELFLNQDDEIASTVSDDEVASSVNGPTSIQEKLADILIEKWLDDHQVFLDDQNLTASDLYTHSALETLLTKKSQSPNFGGISIGEDNPDGLDLEMSEVADDEIFAINRPSAFNAPPGVLNEVDPDLLTLQSQLESSFGGSSSSGNGNWLLRGRPTVNGQLGETLHHFRNTESPRIGAREASELSDELSNNESEEEDNSCLSAMEREEIRNTSTQSIDFDDVYNQNLSLYSGSSPEKANSDRRSGRSEDSGVQLNGNSSIEDKAELLRKASLGFMRMDWSFSERSDPCFISKVTEVTVREAECACINVEVDGTIPIDVYWYRVFSNDAAPVQLEENERVEFVSAADHPGKHSLFLWHLTEEDAGEYLAVAVNEIGSNKQGFKINVVPNDQQLLVPEFQKPLTGDDVCPGETARLRCKVFGVPQPRVVFKKGSQALSNSEKFQHMRIGDRAYTLSVYDVQPEDAGQYTCIAKNAAGSCQSTALISLVAKESRLSLPTQDEPLVDTSPSASVSSHVRRLSGDVVAKNLFLDTVEPLIGTATSSSPSTRLKSERKRSAFSKPRSDINNRKVSTPGAKERPKKVTPPAEKEPEIVEISQPTDEDINAHRVGIDECDLVMDCGLKRVSSCHRKDFVVNRPPSQPPTQSKKKMEVQSVPPEPFFVPVKKECEMAWLEPGTSSSTEKTSPNLSRRDSLEKEEPVSSLKERFEKGMARPVPKNMETPRKPAGKRWNRPAPDLMSTSLPSSPYSSKADTSAPEFCRVRLKPTGRPIDD